jgi:glycosyltransferase involved in cell wall biosynthesis
MVLTLIYTRMSGRKFVFVCVDDPDVFHQRIARFTARLCLPLVSILATRTFATSLRLSSQIRRFTNRVEYLTNGVNLQKLEGTQAQTAHRHPFTVGLVASFGKWIDFDMIRGVAHRMSDIRFLLVGGGECFVEVAQGFSGMTNVELTGFLPHQEAMGMLSQMDLCLIPYRMEAHHRRRLDRVSPVKLFEYWAAGKPVIATPFDELQRIGQDIVVFVKNAKELEEAIQKLRKDSALRKLLVDKGRREVRKFDWEIMVQRYLNVLGQDDIRRGQTVSLDKRNSPLWENRKRGAGVVS